MQDTVLCRRYGTTSGMNMGCRKCCYVLGWSLLSDATMQMDGLFATPHNIAVQHYYIRDNVHVEKRFSIVTNCDSSWRQIAREGPV
jgi:hypothetical protein